MGKIMDNYFEWEAIPEKYNYVVQDIDGVTYAFTSKPSYGDDGIWVPEEGLFFADFIEIFSAQLLPKELRDASLRERPKKEEDTKYVLTDETKTITHPITGRDVKLNRIKATATFGQVKEGTVGGWVESENNLAMRGTCWVHDNAMVFDEGWVGGSAKTFSNAMVYGYAMLTGNAHMNHDAVLRGNAELSEDCSQLNNSLIEGCVTLFGAISVEKNAYLSGEFVFEGKGHIGKNAYITKEKHILQLTHKGDTFLLYTHIGGIVVYNRGNTYEGKRIKKIKEKFPHLSKLIKYFKSNL